MINVLPPARFRPKFPYVGSISIPGLPLIHVENRKGSTRSGVDQDGNPWSVTMPAHYGEFEGTRGADGDPIDVFVGEDAFAPYVYIVAVNQVGTKDYDECKVFVGFNTLEAVASTFAAAYTRPGMKHGQIRRMSVLEFTAWLDAFGHLGMKIDVGAEMHKSLPWEWDSRC